MMRRASSKIPESLGDDGLMWKNVKQVFNYRKTCARRENPAFLIIFLLNISPDQVMQHRAT